MPRAPVKIQPAGVSRFNAMRAAGRSVPPPTTRTPGPALSREHFPDRALNALQSKVNEALLVAKGNPFADGNLVQGVPLTGGQSTAVAHSLGRAWEGYFVLNMQGGGATVYATPNTSTDARTIHLTASANTTVDVWVY